MSCKRSKFESSSCDASPGIGLPNKKSKSDDDAARLKKANRLKENLRQMLLPENPDDQDTKKKNAIYAYNFFEKVEETFVSSGRDSKFKRFVQILKSFDPEVETTVNLYNKLENLFLPDHPDLIEIFLTFLKPTEAYQAGKFFEHFMVTNMGTFINKLNIYFNKQPAQIRKIYNSLNELSEDADLTIERIKSKILPLLKGNQFLIDWFLQIFPEERPPENLMQCNETVSLKEIDSNPTGNIFETMQSKDLFDDCATDSPSCQLRYINSRIFYGSRLLLPAKLAFMAEPANEDQTYLTLKTVSENQVCVHGIRELGEEYLRVKDKNISNNSEKSDKSDEPQINIINEQSKDQPNYEFCDEAVLRMHAARLNPSLYSSENFTGNFYRTIRSEDGKCSPKKQIGRAPSTCSSGKDKYKSPKKSILKSPTPSSNNIFKKSTNSETNVFATAKKLKALCEEEINNEHLLDEQIKVKKKKIQKSKLKNQDSGSEIAESEYENEFCEEFSSKSEKTQPWTREEDKIILEEVKLGFELQEELMNRIAKKLSGRKENEINLRYQFLMDVLSQIQNKS